ncbi:MAG: hypothetical protein ACI39E_06890, partial [Acutalibacteraceae bacterium]
SIFKKRLTTPKKYCIILYCATMGKYPYLLEKYSTYRQKMQAKNMGMRTMPADPFASALSGAF